VSVAPLANLPDPARRKLAEIGPVWGTDIQRHRDLVLEIYRPLLAAAPKAGVEVTRGIPTAAILGTSWTSIGAGRRRTLRSCCSSTAALSLR
jgi:hypothetical protein